jgi:uncharacterized membrane protein YagU involved in acid resistance
MSELPPVKSGLARALVLFVTLTNAVFAGVLILGGLNILHSRNAILGSCTIMAASIPLVFTFATLRNIRVLQRAQGWLYSALAVIIAAAGLIVHALSTIVFAVVLLTASAVAQWALLRMEADEVAGLR